MHSELMEKLPAASVLMAKVKWIRILDQGRGRRWRQRRWVIEEWGFVDHQTRIVYEHGDGSVPGEVLMI